MAMLIIGFLLLLVLGSGLWLLTRPCGTLRQALGFAAGCVAVALCLQYLQGTANPLGSRIWKLVTDPLLWLLDLVLSPLDLSNADFAFIRPENLRPLALN